jgi:hypothetical protein
MKAEDRHNARLSHFFLTLHTVVFLLLLGGHHHSF